MWWRKKHHTDARDALISVLKDEVTVLRQRHQYDSERIDRLMEVLARKSGIDLIMPTPPISVKMEPPLPNPWKDPNPVTDLWPESVGAGQYEKEKH